MVKVWVVNIKEVRIYYRDGTFDKLGNSLMESLSTIELRRVVSLMKDRDTTTQAWRTILSVFIVNREEMRDEHNALLTERRRKYEYDIDAYLKRSEELTAAGKSRISKDGKFLHFKAGSLSRYRIGMLASYPKPDLLKLIEALTGTPMLEELVLLVQIKEKVEKSSKSSVFT